MEYTTESCDTFDELKVEIKPLQINPVRPNPALNIREKLKRSNETNGSPAAVRWHHCFRMRKQFITGESNQSFNWDKWCHLMLCLLEINCSIQAHNS